MWCDTQSFSQPGSGVSRIPYSINPVWILAGTAAYIRRWQPSSVPPQAAAFARDVTAAAAPGGRERAKNLLWAAGRLADWGTGLGLDPVPGVLLHPSVIERFTAHAPGLTGVTRRTLRTNLRFLARRGRSRAGAGGRAAAPRAGQGTLCPGADRRLSRARRRPAHGGAADAGGRAGLPRGRRRADPRRPARRSAAPTSPAAPAASSWRCAASRPRAVPVLARYHQPLLAAAAFAGTGLVTGGHDPARRNVTTPLTRALAGGTGLPRLDTSRLRATWLRRLRATPRAGCVHARRRDHLQPAPRRPARHPGPRQRGRGGRAAGRAAVSIPLPRLEDIIEASGIAPRIEALLPAGVRHRQLRVATLLLGMMLTLADRRPAHLTEVHAALTALPGRRPAPAGGDEDWKTGPHQLTYRQAERTFGLITAALAKDTPDGTPSAALTAVLDDLLEASIPPDHKDTSTALAADWTDVESFSRPPRHGSTACADPEASWGHRNSNLPGPKGEMFFGYYLSAATMTRDEDGPPVPELTRRITLSSCHADPVRALAPVLTRMPAAGIRARRHPGRLRLRPPRRRRLGPAAPRRRRAARPGPAPARPRPPGHHPRRHHRQRQPLLPRHPAAAAAPGPAGPRRHRRRHHRARHQQTAELARHKLGRLTADDADGYHRVTCPAAMGKLRCPLRPASMTLDRSPARRSSPRRSTRRPAAPSRPSPSHPTSRRRPGRNTTTPQRRTAAPTPAAPPPNEASPPSRTRPATPSAAAGAASWA